jgi:phosphoribosylformylglycinamidine synthase
MPWEILLSEAQERMTLAVPAENVDAFLHLSRKMDVESTVIGAFTDSGYFHCTYEGKTVAYLSLDFLHNGLPRMRLRARWTPPGGDAEGRTPEPDHHGETLKKMLGRLNICSKEYVVRQYDHEVQGGSAVKPLVGAACSGPSDAAVVRPLLDKDEGVVVACGIVPRYSDLDTYHMAACALDEALRNYICVGGIPAAGPFSTTSAGRPCRGRKEPRRRIQAGAAGQGEQALYDYALAFGCPMISGKDSNEERLHRARRQDLHPAHPAGLGDRQDTDVGQAVTMDFKRPGALSLSWARPKTSLVRGNTSR